MSPFLTAVMIGAEAPALSLQVGSGAPGAAAVKMILLLTVLSFAPALMLTMTSFLRFTIVFAFLRQALGVQGAPPAQVMTGLALFMTAATMGPVAEQIHLRALAPYLDGKLSEKAALEAGSEPLRTFMLRATREEDLIMFHGAAHAPLPRTPADLKLSMLVPAYVTSELHTAFRMGLMVLIPFLVIDLVVASVLMSLGMAMLSPMLVSLPLKLLVFLFVDGWSLVVGSLMRGAS